jgi:hypothetical protein
MSEPRITVTIDTSGDGPSDEVRIYANEAGVQALIRELSALSRTNDHFHMMSPNWGGDELRAVVYEPDELAIDHLKVIIRQDDWDREFFRHVLPTGDGSPSD